MKFLYKLKAFTLAEVMITLTIIGVISAIVVPVAFHSRPDETVMKFKKAHNAFYQVINTLVTSDKYYCKGDLGLKADCETKITNSASLTNYFCTSIADLLSTKLVTCLTTSKGSPGHWLASNESANDIVDGYQQQRPVTQETITATKEKFDSVCKRSAIVVGAEIETTDGIVYFNAGTATQFGVFEIRNTETGVATGNLRVFSPPDQFPANYADEQGFDIAYKIFCMDVDGIPDNATTANCRNECPFGYGVRADGKIMNGKRADEWLEKDIQMEN